jgi:hypothetical protein
MIIHSGMTSQLKPLDVSVNKPFNYLVRKHHDAWLRKDNHINSWWQNKKRGYEKL